MPPGLGFIREVEHEIFTLYAKKFTGKSQQDPTVPPKAGFTLESKMRLLGFNYAFLFRRSQGDDNISGLQGLPRSVFTDSRSGADHPLRADIGSQSIQPDQFVGAGGTPVRYQYFFRILLAGYPI